jgi:hypothetical protein
METTWHKIKKGVSDGFKNLSDKTGEMTKIGRLKIEIIAVKRDIEKAFIELGGRVYEKVEDKKDKDILPDQRIGDLIKVIKSLEARLKKLEEKILRVREHRLANEE